MTDPQVEELLEHLYLVQVEGGGDVAPELPEGTAQAASALGYLQAGEGACKLTEAGIAAARDVVRRRAALTAINHLRLTLAGME